MMKVICASDQCEASATIWHDGQITLAGEKRVKVFSLQRAKQLLQQVAGMSARAYGAGVLQRNRFVI
jgi:hypothetical protein